MPNSDKHRVHELLKEDYLRHLNRREFLKGAGSLVAACALPVSLVKVAFGAGSGVGDFSFAYISDSHITVPAKGTSVRNWDRGLIRSVAEANLLSPKPDFIIYGGDLAQLGKKEEIDLALDLMAKVDAKVYYVMGEHDYYLDLGKHPIQVTGLADYVYLQAHCHLRDAERNFRLDRIVEVRVEVEK